MIIQVENVSSTGHVPISMRCPNCRQLAVLEVYGSQDLQYFTPRSQYTVGNRRCPNVECHTLIIFISNSAEVLVSYPAERLDFDATGIPASIIAPLEEAITCHANQCYTAAAIMVRKTLEMLCKESNATGSNLKQKIASLNNVVILPVGLLDGLDDLRLLGNDAAHFEAQAFNQVGREEVEVSIEFTTEVLKAIYQYNALRDRIRNLKKTQEV